MARGTAADAEVEYDEEDGRPCVRVTCCESGDEEMAFGESEGSIKAALAKLSESCGCGARWHNCDDLGD